MTELTPDEVRKVARLGKLDLTDDEAADARRRLSAVLTHMESLQRLDLAGVEPMAHVGDEPAPLRDDQPGPTLPAEQAVGLAPATYETDDPGAGIDEATGEPRRLRFIRVPKVIGEGGGA